MKHPPIQKTPPLHAAKRKARTASGTEFQHDLIQSTAGKVPPNTPPQKKVGAQKQPKTLPGSDSARELSIKHKLLDIGQQFAGMVTFRMDPASQALTWGSGFGALFGLSEQPLPSNADELSRLLGQTDRTRFLNVLQHAFKNEVCPPLSCVLSPPGLAPKNVRILLSLHAEEADHHELLGIIQDVSAFVADQRAYAKVENIAQLGSWTLYPNQGIITCSRQLCRIFDWPEEPYEHPFADWYDVLHPEDRERVCHAVLGLMENGGHVRLEHRIIRADGSIRHLRCDAALDGAPAFDPCIIGTQHDLTEMVEVRQSLLLTEQRWNLALENSGIAVWDWDIPTGNVVFTPQFYELLGYTQAEWPSHFETWETSVHPDDRGGMDKALERCWKGETDHCSNEHRLRCHDGTWKWVRCAGTVIERDTTGKPQRILGTQIDVDHEHLVTIALSRREHLTQNLQKAHQEFLDDDRTTTAFQSMLHIAIDHTNSEFGLISEVVENESGTLFLRTMAISDDIDKKAKRGLLIPLLEAELGGRDFSGLFGYVLRTGEVVLFNDPDDPASPNHPSLRSFLGIPIFHGIEMVGLMGLANRPGGYDAEQLSGLDPLTASLSAMIMRLRHRNQQADVELRLRVAVQQAERASRAKGDFLAIMSHEIRTPLNGIIGMAELLKEARLSKDQSHQINAMLQSGHALVSIIDDILDFAKIEANAIVMHDDIVDLPAMLDSVLDLLGRQALEKHLDFGAIIDPDLPLHVMGDTGRIRQLLVNLVGNALKFTLSGNVMIRVGLKSSWLTFTVTDTGHGLSRSEQSKVFDPFTQLDYSASRHHGGTGLGLAICKRLVHLMHGRIGVTSRRGRGSAFWFRIPFRPSLTTPPEPTAAARNSAVAWVADSSAVLRESIHCICKRCGWEVREFATAAHLLRAMKEPSKPCDLLFVDDKWLSPAQAQTLTVDWQKHATPGARAIVTRISKECPDPKFEKWPSLQRPWHLTTLLSLCRQNTGAIPAKIRRKNKRLQLRVLVAEDNAINASVLATMLRRLGCQSRLVSDGEQATRLFQTETFDVVLMDCRMPVLDGYQATRQIRKLEKKRKVTVPVRIVAVTANAFADDRERCFKAGMDDHLSKPFTLEKLIAVLQPNPAQDATTRTLGEEQVLSREFEELIRIVGQQNAARLAKLYLQEVSERLRSIRKAAHDADWQTAAKEAHAISGTSGLFGMAELVRTAQRIETEAEETHYLSADLLEAFAATIEQARHVLEAKTNALLPGPRHKRGATPPASL